MPNELTVEELVKAMRLCAEKTKNGETCVTGQKDCPFGVTVMDCTERMNLATADALESLAAERDAYRDKLAAALAENTKLAEQVQANRRAQQPNEPLELCEKIENFVQTKFGYCFYTLDSQPFIYNLYVHPKYRRCGYSRKLLEIVVNEIRRSGYGGKIRIQAKPREGSIGLATLARYYESMGFIVCDVHPPEAGAINE